MNNPPKVDQAQKWISYQGGYTSRVLQDLFSQEIRPLTSFPCGPHHENECRSDSCGLGSQDSAFQHKSLSLGNSPSWLPRAGARLRVPSQFPGTYHSDSCTGVIYNHFVFSSKKLKNVTYCGIPVAETCRESGHWWLSADMPALVPNPPHTLFNDSAGPMAALPWHCSKQQRGKDTAIRAEWGKMHTQVGFCVWWNLLMLPQPSGLVPSDSSFYL